MRLIGRLIAPLMTFMLAEGYRCTRSRMRYLMRLVIFALISQPFYFRLVFGRAPESRLEYCTHWNVLFTLAIALASLILIESQMSPVPRLILTGCCVSLTQFGDWLYMIPVWVVIFHAFRNDKQKSAVLFILASIILQTIIWLPQYESFAAFSYQYGTLLALIPIRCYTEQMQRETAKKRNNTRLLYYVYYPLHMSNNH